MKNNIREKFLERIRLMLKDSQDFQTFFNIIHKPLLASIRINTIKISVDDAITRLKERWKIEQPFLDYKSAIIIKTRFEPGDLGNSIEHKLGYYYIQDIDSMMPVLALKPTQKDAVLDMCAAPGSKTTQIASLMKNSGLIISNDNSFKRIKALASNLQRCGAANTVITNMDGNVLCKRLKKMDMKINKILVDAPCSGEGTFRKDISVLERWNPHMIKKFSNIQKKLLSSAIKLAPQGAEIIYSTCTFAPEENESIIQYAIDNFNVKIKPFSLPKTFITREGFDEWQHQQFDSEIKKTKRIWPQDNNTGGFFIAKLKKV